MADREEKATAEERARESARENRDLHISSIDVNSLDRKIVDRILKTGLKSEIPCFIDEYFAALGERNIQSFLFRQYITMNVYFSAVSMLQQR